MKRGELYRVSKSLLTNYIGVLSEEKINLLDQSLKIDIDIYA